MASRDFLGHAVKVSKQQMALNRERILDTAATLFRERGFDGIGVADLMEKAGLTHGGFYGHFASKEALMAEAATRAGAQAAGLWEDARQAGAETPAELRTAFGDYYLSAGHRAAPGQGCVVAALGADAARQGGPVREAFTRFIRSEAERIAAISPGRNAAARRSRALADYAQMVGAMVLARAVDDTALSDEILAAARERLGLDSKAGD